jgi:hypothetical protein
MPDADGLPRLRPVSICERTMHGSARITQVLHAVTPGGLATKGA